MLAYVNLVQAREKSLGVDVLTHQKWSGAAYVDGMLSAIQSGSSGSRSMGQGNTETGELDSIIMKRKEKTNLFESLADPVCAWCRVLGRGVSRRHRRTGFAEC